MRAAGSRQTATGPSPGQTAAGWRAGARHGAGPARKTHWRWRWSGRPRQIRTESSARTSPCESPRRPALHRRAALAGQRRRWPGGSADDTPRQNPPSGHRRWVFCQTASTQSKVGSWWALGWGVLYPDSMAKLCRWRAARRPSLPRLASTAIADKTSWPACLGRRHRPARRPASG